MQPVTDRQSRAVSIHAPVKGATDGRPISHCDLASFNPRPREGATMLMRTRIAELERFNPRPREGATLPAMPSSVASLFQSTPP